MDNKHLSELQFGAVILDFDGILVDTEPFHYQAFLSIFESLSLSLNWDQYKTDYLGFDDRDVIKKIFHDNDWFLSSDNLAKLAERKAAMFAETVAQSDLIPYPGVMELIDKYGGTLPLGLCSGSLDSDINPVVSRLGLAEAFDATVTANDVPLSKPDPASYQLIVQRLQERFPDRSLHPARIITFEDSPAGIESANKAGIISIGVTTNFPAEALSDAHVVLGSLLDFC